MEAFGTVLIVVCVIAVVVAAISYWGSGRLYRGVGRGGDLTLDEPSAEPPLGGAAADREAREEIRQMLEAKSARREARGEGPLDVEAELAGLTAASGPRDEGLRDEVRQLVIARNERRVRQGKQPLDVEAEVERQLRDLGA
jgi:hypothetical protein